VPLLSSLQAYLDSINASSSSFGMSSVHSSSGSLSSSPCLGSTSEFGKLATNVTTSPPSSPSEVNELTTELLRRKLQIRESPLAPDALPFNNSSNAEGIDDWLPPWLIETLSSSTEIIDALRLRNFLLTLLLWAGDGLPFSDLVAFLREGLSSLHALLDLDSGNFDTSWFDMGFTSPTPWSETEEADETEAGRDGSLLNILELALLIGALLRLSMAWLGDCELVPSSESSDNSKSWTEFAAEIMQFGSKPVMMLLIWRPGIINIGSSMSTSGELWLITLPRLRARVRRPVGSYWMANDRIVSVTESLCCTSTLWRRTRSLSLSFRRLMASCCNWRGPRNIFSFLISST